VCRFATGLIRSWGLAGRPITGGASTKGSTVNALEGMAFRLSDIWIIDEVLKLSYGAFF
jgi:hypothetical protein